MTNSLYPTVQALAKATGCEVRTNAAGNPMFTMTTTELIKFLLDAADDVKLQSVLKQMYSSTDPAA